MVTVRARALPPISAARLSGDDAARTELIDLCGHLVAVHHIDLADPFAGADRLAGLGRQDGQLPINRRGDSQVLQPLADKAHGRALLLAGGL